MSTTTSRLGLVKPATGDAVSVLRTSAGTNMDTLDTAATITMGTSLPAQPVTSGKMFLSTSTKVLYVSDGSAWHSIGTDGGALPVGSISGYGGASDPTDQDGIGRWVIADGRALSRSTYASLFSVYSTIHGAGDGSTTFNLPDLGGRVLVAPLRAWPATRQGYTAFSRARGPPHRIITCNSCALDRRALEWLAQALAWQGGAWRGRALLLMACSRARRGVPALGGFRQIPDRRT